ncbi:SGNH hydrolase, partial [Kibdelosporangium lantanae]
QRLEAEDTAQVAWTQPAGQSYQVAVQTGDGWSSNNQKVLVGNAVNASVDLTFTAPIEADYALGAMLSKAPNYGVLSLTLDRSVPLLRGDTFDAYSPNMIAVFQALGGAHLTAGQHTITIKSVGTNPASTQNRYAIGVDYLFTTPINNVTTASFTDAMNNDGISDDGATVTSAKSLDLSGGSLSAQTLAAAG